MLIEGTSFFKSMTKKYLAYLEILDSKLKAYMLYRGLSEEDFIKYGEHILYKNKNIEEFKYKNELILTCNYNVMQSVGLIEIKYK